MGEVILVPISSFVVFFFFFLQGWCLVVGGGFSYISCIVPEETMATHSNTLAWKIPWMEEPGGLQSMGS